MSNFHKMKWNSNILMIRSTYIWGERKKQKRLHGEFSKYIYEGAKNGNIQEEKQYFNIINEALLTRLKAQTLWGCNQVKQYLGVECMENSQIQSRKMLPGLFQGFLQNFLQAFLAGCFSVISPRNLIQNSSGIHYGILPEICTAILQASAGILQGISADVSSGISLGIHSDFFRRFS